jgi:hypothetical protein
MPVGKIYFSFPKRPGRLWDTPSLPFNETGVLSQGLKLARLRMSGGIPLLPYMPSHYVETHKTVFTFTTDRTWNFN